ncbi:protein root UVB sensitive 5 isoform X2 [Cynara cardunculus var. scolymus]|uniref:protein root UVB sensitive 5 isoform X2 n=1 Tax=Cynara cardunculus var. scolymus TaxID=59895 RepID=UPI000D6300C4|nr:protein root UVB sensitive 5 isoform X2 [Cynara cardunculus var. scolymus]
MSFALHLSFPNLNSYRTHKLITPTRLHGVQFICNFSLKQTNFSSEDDTERISDGSQHRVVLVEKYGDGTLKRYILDEELQLTTFLEDDSKSNGFSSKELPWLPDIVKDFVLPAGFPGSVSNDYLEYMLLQFPTNVTAWICQTLVTSSLLKAVGLDYSSGTTAAASAAAIRWVSKDGIGAVGRFFIGGRFGNLFDDDPKQWRMYADFIGSAGSIFDLCTPLYPAYFLPLASLGNLAKAVARGLKDPSFRVIQNHFAISGNLGDVAAKSTPGVVTSYLVLASTWMAMRLLHLWLRYQSLSVLQFDTVNLKRARILVNLHVSNSTVLGCEECNKMENILSWEEFSVPRIVFGVSLSDMLGGERSGLKVKMLLELYAKEKYILVVNQQPFKDFETLVSFKDGATSLSVLRSVWQTYWLYKNRSKQDDGFDQLKESLKKIDDRFEDFLQQMRDVGWDIDEINLKIRNDISIEEIFVD